MPGVIDQASAILSSAERRLEAAAQNMANISTPGFKRQVTFTSALDDCDRVASCATSTGVRFNFEQGALSETGQPFDLALFGPGLFQLREGDSLVYARGGSFALTGDGMLADPAGRILQQAGGGDLTLSGRDVQILSDGTVLDRSLPTGRIAVFQPADDAALTAVGGSIFHGDPGRMEEAEGTSVRQGFLERSNVASSDEMVALMAAQRDAESGARVAQFYDQLMGQAIATFTRSSR